MPDTKHTEFSGRLVIVGFGSIGQGVLPLLLRHIDLRPDQITICLVDDLALTTEGIALEFEIQRRREISP